MEKQGAVTRQAAPVASLMLRDQPMPRLPARGKPTTRDARTVEGDPRWRAVLARDPSKDGSFFFAVRTTGIYCKPSCSARHARPENVSFFETAAEAQRAGFRACLRCRPDELGRPAAAIVARACRAIEAAETAPSLTELGRLVGKSPFHLHRLFKAELGLTPAEYAAAHRARRVGETLRGSRSVTEAFYEAGYGSSGRFYEAAPAVLGMTPSRYRAGAAGLRIGYSVARCSLGLLLVAATETGVCAIAIGDDPAVLVRELRDRFARAEIMPAGTGFEAWVSAAVDLVEHPRTAPTMPLDIRGTAFQRRVWKALAKIPAGSTRSYTQIATSLGDPHAARAVAGACAANPLAVAIPCHRVVRSDGALSGYRWGIDRKRELLAREGQSDTMTLGDERARSGGAPSRARASARGGAGAPVRRRT